MKLIGCIAATLVLPTLRSRARPHLWRSRSTSRTRTDRCTPSAGAEERARVHVDVPSLGLGRQRSDLQCHGHGLPRSGTRREGPTGRAVSTNWRICQPPSLRCRICAGQSIEDCCADHLPGGGADRSVDSGHGPDAFRSALGGPNNGNEAGPLPIGRREIAWDGRGNNQTTAVAGNPFGGFAVSGACLDDAGRDRISAGSSCRRSGPVPAGRAASMFDNPTYGTLFLCALRVMARP